MRKRVCHFLRHVSVVRVLVFACLDAASRRDIVFCCGQLQLACVGQRHVGHLHQSLAVRSCSHHHGAVEVLQRTARNLTGARRSLVYEHHDGHNRVNRFCCGLVFAVGVLHLSLHAEQMLALREEHVQNLYSLANRSAAVATEVQNERSHAVVLHVEHGAAHVLGATFHKLVVVDISHAVLLHAVVGEVRQLYSLALNLQRHLLAGRRTQHLQHHRRAGVASEVV